MGSEIRDLFHKHVTVTIDGHNMKVSDPEDFVTSLDYDSNKYSMIMENTGRYIEIYKKEISESVQLEDCLIITMKDGTKIVFGFDLTNMDL